MSAFPTITNEKRALYEKIYTRHKELKNYIPQQCGEYGRACKQSGCTADLSCCDSCSLSQFISTVEVILDVCSELEANEREHPGDTRFCDFAYKLREKCQTVDPFYMVKLLECLAS